jgi:hypothetical protein
MKKKFIFAFFLLLGFLSGCEFVDDDVILVSPQSGENIKSPIPVSIYVPQDLNSDYVFYAKVLDPDGNVIIEGQMDSGTLEKKEGYISFSSRDFYFKTISTHGNLVVEKALKDDRKTRSEIFNMPITFEPIISFKMTNSNCFTAYDTQYSDGPNFTKEHLLNTFSDNRFIHRNNINLLFENQSFQILLAQSGIFEFCNYDDFSVFTLYSSDGRDYEGEFNVVAGIFSTQNYEDEDGELFLSYNNFAPMGDIYGCSIVSFIDNHLIYSCSAGDGCGGFSKIYSVGIETGVKTLRDCDYGCLVEDSSKEAECRVDVLSEIL